jgi:hypothetical protein
MEVELSDDLGYERHQEPPSGAGNTRNGSTSKTLITESGPVGTDTPRDRAGTFEPQIVRKRQRRFEGVRREDPRAVFTWALDEGYRGASRGDLWGQDKGSHQVRVSDVSAFVRRSHDLTPNAAVDRGPFRTLSVTPGAVCGVDGVVQRRPLPLDA